LILAQLYAIGVVGAILINIGSTSTDFSLSLPRSTRLLMLASAGILFFVEFSIAVEKPKASLFAAIVLVIGLAARAIARRTKRQQPHHAPPLHLGQSRRSFKTAPGKKYLVAVRGKSEPLLRFAIEEAQAQQAMLYVLRVKEIVVNTLPETMLTVFNATDAVALPLSPAA
jgi:hypothetical protein